MPSGRVHDLTTLGLAVGLMGASNYAQRVALTSASTEAILVGGACLTSGLLLSPDLDLSGTVNTRSTARWRLLRYLWYPYGLLSKHRGLSHHWLIGPVIRLAYLFAICSLLFYPLQLLHPTWAHDISAWLATLNPSFLLSSAIGYVAGQWLHIGLDKLDHVT